MSISVEKQLQTVLEVSEISYKQEVERNQHLLTKSNYIISYISVLFIFINTLMLLLPESEMIKYKMLLHAAIMLPLIISFMYAVSAQILKKGQFMPTGTDIIKRMQKHPEEYDSEIKMTNKLIRFYSTATKALQSSNDREQN